jgi:uncharacterized protein with NAD-binding domain and iron-sulfur cluster
MPTAAVLGGGLAALTVAKELRPLGFDVTVYERGALLGGKASAFPAERRDGDDILYEHGYHFFAGWYVNTRKILKEIGVTGLVDFDRWHYLEPMKNGEMQLRTLAIPKSLFDVRTAWNTLKSAPASIPETLLYLYFLLDTVGERLQQESRHPSARVKARRAVLDRVSRTAMLRAQWYATPIGAELDLQNTLKASAIPSHHMSAFTVKKLQDYWFANFSPFLSVLDKDLQTGFIDPYVAYLKKAGVTFRTRHEWTRFGDLDGGKLKDVRIMTPDGERVIAADVFVVTTPLDVTRQLLTPELVTFDPHLARMHHLQAEPMASLHLRLKRKLPFPREHVIFGGNRYGLSFVDQSILWPSMPNGRDKTYLSFISADFAALAGFTKEQQYDALMAEVVRYLPFTSEDVEHWELRSNVDTPLFINTVGAWPDRPAVCCGVENLFFAGDWVKNDVDLACMEGAVSAALDCAREIGVRYQSKLSNAQPPKGSEVPRQFGETKAWFLARAAAPAAFALWLMARAADAVRQD